MGIDFRGVAAILIFLGAVMVLLIWGAWGVIDWFVIEEIITTTEPITPELKIIVNENIVDTLYIYKKP